jgi:hypothetical protein
MIQLHPDFKEFLKLLNSAGTEYLVVDGYAVAYHGHPRATGDLDIWVAVTPDNARRVADSLRRFEFSQSSVAPEMFLTEGQVIRMGVPPLRIELLTGISGVEFSACYSKRIIAEVEGVSVPLINLEDLKANKLAAGRLKDLGDLKELQDPS